jgi:competence protein ComEA
VGAAKAQAIIRYRDEVGPFRSVEELEEVKGIGPNTVKRNKARISVTNPKG